SCWRARCWAWRAPRGRSPSGWRRRWWARTRACPGCRTVAGRSRPRRRARGSTPAALPWWTWRPRARARDLATAPSAARSPGPRRCPLRVARRLLPALESRSLDTLAQFFGIEIERRHRAGPDAMAAARILQRLVAIAKEQGAGTLADLGQMRNAERGTRNAKPLVSSAFRVPRSDFE